jgi:putative DNA methylase
MATTALTETVPAARMRRYQRADAAVFLKTKEAFGGLSNMASGFPLRVNGVRILTSEALYQACRFPHLPKVQRLIIEQTSPMTAKMKGKPYRGDSRPDWDDVRVRIMRWCLRVKLIQNYPEFSRLLLETGERPIVEQSRKDDFWGAKPIDDDTLIGENVLGRLLMELREEIREGRKWPAEELRPLDIPNFLLYGRPIEPVRGPDAPAAPSVPVREPAPPAAPGLFDRPKDRMPASPPRRKLIEVSIPLEAINKASAREKSIRHGHPSTLHLWWARRPLAACRAVLFAQLVDDPSAWPDRFPDEAAQEAERKRLHRVIERLVPWEASTDEAILNEARFEIARSVAWGLGEEPPPPDPRAVLDYLQAKAPPVYDPFCGGGSIPLEAQRLGLRAYGSDLNPVAVLISKALVEIPPKFAGRPPVNPVSRREGAHGAWQGRGAQGLAEDVRHYGAWMRAEAERRIGHLYPKARLPDGGEATVIAWLWARTVRSPDPAAKGAMVPLVSSFLLSTKEGRKAWAEPVIDAAAPDGWRFEVKTGTLSKADEKRLTEGTKAGRATFRCVLTGAPIGGGYIDEEAQAGRMSARLMAVVAEGARSRIYLAPTAEHEAAAAGAERHVAEHGDTMDLPTQECRGTFASNAQGRRYCFKTFADYFTPRQLVALTTFSDLVAEAREQALADARDAGLPDDPTPLAQGGTGATAYADAVATYLAFAHSKLADRGSSICTWFTERDSTRPTFARQAIPMTWDFAELNTLLDGTGSFVGAVQWTAESLEAQGVGGRIASIAPVDAAKNSFPVRPIAICTDPPYYDNIGYADLSDFFYVWLRRSLAGVWPDLFRRLVTPKAEELVATPYRHGSKDKAEAFFMQGMSDALAAMGKAAVDGAPLAIYYAFKQSEVSADGITSPGWASFLQAVVDAGLAVDGTWPIRTELANRMIGRDANALASSIVLVCRKRAADAPVATRSDFLRALKRDLPDAIDDIRRAGVGPVDMQQSVIGPGMGIFTRHARVLEDDDSPMSVRTALALINRVWQEIENELDAAFDAPTQVALAWFASYGFDARQSGELIMLANAKDIPVGTLFSSGVFRNLHGKAGLIPREELPAGWSPETDKAPTVWECVQHTARVLNAEEGGAQAAGALVAAMGPRAEAARALTYRLFEIATQKGWASEALVYNQLAEEWPHLEDAAVAARPVAEAQATLF